MIYNFDFAHIARGPAFGEVYRPLGHLLQGRR
jgi:hypothetical protein